MRELSMKKLFWLAGTLLLLLLAFLAGSVVMPSAQAAGVNKGGKGGSSNQTKAVVVVNSVAGNIIQATIQAPADQQGKRLMILTTTSTSYKPDRSSVAVGKTLYVLGTVNSNGSVTAQVLGVYDPTVGEYGGVITGIDGAILTVKVKNTTLTIRLTDSTQFFKADAIPAGVKDGQVHPAARSDLQVGEAIVAAGRLNSDGSLTAAKIVIMPAGGK